MKTKAVYYQPVLTNAEWETSWLPSFGVFARKNVAQSLFPGKEIKRYSGNDIEEPTYFDMEVLSRKPMEQRTMYFKDEGGYYSYKLTKDGQPISDDINVMYEYGSLQELSCTSQRMAKLIAKGHGRIATFG